MTAQNIPRALLISVDDLNTPYLANKFTERGHNFEKNGDHYDWVINTKYYRAKISLDVRQLIEPEVELFSKTAEVLIISINENNNRNMKAVLDQLQTYSDHFENIETKICLLELGTQESEIFLKLRKVQKLF